MNNELQPQSSIENAVDNAENTAKLETFDSVNHPSHYNTHPSGVETIDIVREFDFALGNAWKYLMRFRYKGKPKEDLEKAVWYMNDYMSHRDLYNDFSVKHSNEKTEMLINKARKVIAAENVPEVKHALRAILEQALFGRNIVCDFIKAKDELESQVEKIATSLVLGDEFDVVSANTMIAADELLQKINEQDAKQKQLNDEIVEAQADSANKAETWLKNNMSEVDTEHVVQVWVDDKTKEVFGFWQPTFSLEDHANGHTENVEIPDGVYALGQESARDYALKLVDEHYAPYRTQVHDETPTETSVETPAEEQPKKRHRRKKTAE